MFTTRQRRINYLCQQIVNVRRTNDPDMMRLEEEYIGELETLFTDEKIKKDKPHGSDVLMFLEAWLNPLIISSTVGEFVSLLMTCDKSLMKLFTYVCVRWLKRMAEDREQMLHNGRSELYHFAEKAHNIWKYHYGEEYAERLTGLTVERPTK